MGLGGGWKETDEVRWRTDGVERCLRRRNAGEHYKKGRRRTGGEGRSGSCS